MTTVGTVRSWLRRDEDAALKRWVTSVSSPDAQRSMARTTLPVASPGPKPEKPTPPPDASKDGKSNRGGGSMPLLCAAAGAGAIRCCTVLLEAGADAGCVDALGRTPLHHAAGAGARTSANLPKSPSKSTGAAVPKVSPFRSDSPISASVASIPGLEAGEGAVEAGLGAVGVGFGGGGGEVGSSRTAAVLAQLLVAAGAAVDVPDAEGRTPLYTAVRCYRGNGGPAGGLGELIGAGEDKVDAGMSEWVPASALEVLVQRGASLEWRDRKGLTPLEAAAKEAPWCLRPELADLLMRLGAVASPREVPQMSKSAAESLAQTWRSGNTPRGRDVASEAVQHALIAATKEGSVIKATVALGEGADPNQSTADGEVALIEAVKGRNERCVELLLRSGAVPSVSDADGCTALHWVGNSVALARSLLAAGAFVDAVDNAGRTPLFNAVLASRKIEGDSVEQLSSEQSTVAEVLLDNGAAASATDTSGKTAVQAAEADAPWSVASEVAARLKEIERASPGLAGGRSEAAGSGDGETEDRLPEDSSPKRGVYAALSMGTISVPDKAIFLHRTTPRTGEGMSMSSPSTTEVVAAPTAAPKDSSMGRTAAQVSTPLHKSAVGMEFSAAGDEDDVESEPAPVLQAVQRSAPPPAESVDGDVASSGSDSDFELTTGHVPASARVVSRELIRAPEEASGSVADEEDALEMPPQRGPAVVRSAAPAGAVIHAAPEEDDEAPTIHHGNHAVRSAPIEELDEEGLPIEGVEALPEPADRGVDDDDRYDNEYGDEYDECNEQVDGEQKAGDEEGLPAEPPAPPPASIADVQVNMRAIMSARKAAKKIRRKVDRITMKKDVNWRSPEVRGAGWLGIFVGDELRIPCIPVSCQGPSWREFYFVLEPDVHAISYYVAEFHPEKLQKDKFVKRLDLHDVYAVQDEILTFPAGALSTFVFAICTNTKFYYFCTETYEEKQTWVRLFRRHYLGEGSASGSATGSTHGAQTSYGGGPASTSSRSMPAAPNSFRSPARTTGTPVGGYGSPRPAYGSGGLSAGVPVYGQAPGVPPPPPGSPPGRAAPAGYGSQAWR